MPPRKSFLGSSCRQCSLAVAFFNFDKKLLTHRNSHTPSHNSNKFQHGLEVSILVRRWHRNDNLNRALITMMAEKNNQTKSNSWNPCSIALVLESVELFTEQRPRIITLAWDRVHVQGSAPAPRTIKRDRPATHLVASLLALSGPKQGKSEQPAAHLAPLIIPN